jgi:hypothetical protein
MNGRNKRDRRRARETYRDYRDVSERRFDHDEPRREEQPISYAEQLSRTERSRRPSSYGHGYGHGFSDDSGYRPLNVSDRWSDSDPEHDPSWNRGSWERDRDRAREHHWHRDEVASGYGSEFGAWRSGASLGFGPDERPRHSHGSASSDDYRGRGPKDYRRSDERICDEVCDRLTDDWAVDATEVAIKVEGGEVTLTGFVGTRGQKRRAEETAEQVRGVRDVINQLRINPSDTQSHQQTLPSQQQTSRAQRSSSGAQHSSVAADREK